MLSQLVFLVALFSLFWTRRKEVTSDGTPCAFLWGIRFAVPVYAGVAFVIGLFCLNDPICSCGPDRHTSFWLAGVLIATALILGPYQVTFYPDRMERRLPFIGTKTYAHDELLSTGENGANYEFKYRDGSVLRFGKILSGASYLSEIASNHLRSPTEEA